MADKKISALTAATPPLAGTEVLPIVQSGATVKATVNDVRKVLQVVSAQNNTATSSSSSTYADTGLSVSITPLYSTSKILVFVNITGILKQTGDTALGLKLVRNSTDLIVFEAIAGYTASILTNAVGGASTSYLDSPATTSATTYKVQLASLANVASVFVNQNYSGTGYSTITVMEIAQ